MCRGRDTDGRNMNVLDDNIQPQVATLSLIIHNNRANIHMQFAFAFAFTFTFTLTRKMLQSKCCN